MVKRSRLFYRIPIFIAVCFWAILTTGCGGGGGGGGSGSPVGPINPTTTPTPIPTTPITSTKYSVDGYVSKSSISSSIRANIGQTLSQPLGNAPVELIAFDSSGNQKSIDTKTTDSTGYYQFTDETFPTGFDPKNVLIKAKSGLTIIQCVVPALKVGQKIQAPTMDPSTTIQAQIIEKAAASGKPFGINIGELLSILPPEALAQLSSKNKLDTIVKACLAREEAKSLKLGTIKSSLDSWAFEYQQKINDMIEQGELSPTDAWKKFNDLMAEKEKELLPPENIQFIDDLDQIFIFEPITDDMDDPAFWEKWEKMKRERIRERKLKAFSLLTASVKTLFNGDSEYDTFESLAQTFRKSIESAQSIDELQNIFTQPIAEQRKFLEILNHAMLKVGFLSSWVDDIFAIQPPNYGFEYASKLNTFRGGTTATTATPKAQIAYGAPSAPTRPQEYIQLMEDNFNLIYEGVKKVAYNAGLTLTAEQFKAIAYIIWAGTAENLNFPPPPPIEPEPSPILMSGKVSALAKKIDLASITYTHELKSVDWGVMPMLTESNTKTGMAMPAYYNPPSLAYLAATTPIKLYSDNKTLVAEVTTTTLEELAKSELVEIEGLMMKAPLIYSIPVVSPNPGPKPLKILLQVSGGGSTGSSGSTPGYAGGGVSVAPGVDEFAPEPLYIVVRSARILPPPPPPPLELVNEGGKVTQAKTSSGKIIPGIYFFEECQNPSYEGAILEPDYVMYAASPSGGAAETKATTAMWDPNRIQLSPWVGKKVQISGTRFVDSSSSDGGGYKQTIMVREIKAAQ